MLPPTKGNHYVPLLVKVVVHFFYVYYFLAAKINIIFDIFKDMFDFNNYLTIYIENIEMNLDKIITETINNYVANG